jgi:outer membrane protein OmpA-like peptidoglycan-associated protein
LLYLTGYADKEGKKKKDWKENNDRLAEGRAEAVKRWLVEKLGDLIDKEDIITEGCDDWHYKFSNRFVEVRIY